MNFMEELEKGAITRTALGRFGFIGELYDARTECLSSRSLFKSSLPENMIESRDLKRMEFEYKFTENISDWFDLIKVEAELQVGVLCNLITLDGSGKFLAEQKKSERTVSCSLICKIQTVCQKFYAAWSEILEHVDLKGLEDDKNTHVIVECYWGANCLLSVEYFCKSEYEKHTVKGRLGAEMRSLISLISAKGGGELKKVKESLSSKSDVQIKVNADVVPENGWPTSVEGFFNFMQEVPKILEKSNEGKGKPLKYVMIPLSTIRKLAKVDCDFDNLVVQIGESFFLSTVYFFDEIATIKRKFYDHVSELDEYRKYVLPEVYEKSKRQLKNLVVQESSLKQIIADNWASVRSGAMPLRDLMRSLEKFKSQLNLIQYECHLHSSQELHAKLFSIKNCLSKGITYLGLGESFSELVALNPLSEFIVFLTSGKTRESKLSQNTLYHFLTLAGNSEPSSKFVVVDLDYGTTFLDNKIVPPKCVRLKGSQILSLDLYGDYVSNSGKNFAKLREGSNCELAIHKPGNRVTLEMVCPNFQNICSSDTVVWDCFRCKSKIEYGFDGYFYCSCGRGPSSSYSFRCGDPKHGNFFVAPEDNFLEKMLSNLRSVKEMNILILGQAGVGKSTWINSIINYLTYETLEMAEKGGVICAVPTSVAMFDPQNSTGETVPVRKKSDEKNKEVSNFGTQYSHSYSFLWEDRLVRLIDTPGLGDARGVEQDKQNLMNVMSYIGNLKELHGICILLKAADKFTGVFSYCMKELFVHFHKSVTSNIVFCITNARSTFYGPGQIAVILEKLIDGLGVKKELALGRHNMFCLDNEGFLFLHSLRQSKIHCEEQMKALFSESWKISLNETKRLFDTVKSFRPHTLVETVALFETRNRILSLTQPLAEIDKVLKSNITAIKESQEEVEKLKRNREKLSELLSFNEIQVETEPLPHRRIVCTKPSCVNYIPRKSSSVTEIEYISHCHKKCELQGVELNTVNNPLIKSCKVMSNGICTYCGCSWSYHMQINFVQKLIEREVKREDIEETLIKEQSAEKDTEEFIQNLKTVVEEYKKEQEFIFQASLKFGMFLKQNAITVHNDGLAAYLEHLIREEENKPFKSESDHRLLKSTKDTLKRYEEEVKTFEHALSKADKTESVTVADLNELENELCQLKLTGGEIRKSLETFRNMASKTSHYSETPIQIKRENSNTSIILNKIYQLVKLATSIVRTVIDAIF